MDHNLQLRLDRLVKLFDKDPRLREITSPAVLAVANIFLLLVAVGWRQEEPSVPKQSGENER